MEEQFQAIHIGIRRSGIEKLFPEKLAQKIPEDIHQINLENADRGECRYTLSDMLCAKKIASLRKMAKLHGLKGFSKKDRGEIVPPLMEKIMDPERLTLSLLLLQEEEWDLFQKAVRVEEIADNELLSVEYWYLLKMGYMCLYYSDDHFRYIVPREIRDAFKEIEKTGFSARKEHEDLLNKYALATTNLYGAITCDDFVEIFNQQNERKTSIEESFSVLMTFVYLDYGYCFWDEYLVNDDFEEDDFESVEDYMKIAAQKPRYLPPQKELLRYSDWSYVEPTPQLRNLRTYLSCDLSLGVGSTEDLLEKIAYLCRCEGSNQRFFDLLEEMEISLDFEQMRTLLTLVTEVQNHSRLWINNGHTPGSYFRRKESI